MTEIPQLPPVSEKPQAVRRITFPLSFIIFFSVLNGTMFPVAVPDISSEFGLLPSEVSWVMTGYILVFAVGALIYGKLADIYPVKRLITAGLLLMNAGALAGFFSVWYPLLIASRLIQAAGGAAIPALAMIVVTRYFRSGLRGRVLGIIASTVALAAGLGPVLGGFISGTFHWRYLFVTSLATIAAIPFLRKMLPEEKRDDTRFDTTGAVLISGGTSCLLVFVTQGSLWLLPAGIVLTGWFIYHIRNVEVPFFNPSLFVNRRYRNTIITTFLSIGTVFGMMFMVPIMLSTLNGLDTNHIGLTMFPGAMSAVIMGAAGGRLSDKRGSIFIVHAGGFLLAAGFIFLSSFAGRAPWIISLSLVICYSGFAFLQSSLPHTVSIVLSKEQTGIGMGMYNLLFFISGAFSTAGISRMLDLETAGLCINPLNSCTAGWLYSNIYIMLASVVVIAVLIFRITFRKGI